MYIIISFQEKHKKRNIVQFNGIIIFKYGNKITLLILNLIFYYIFNFSLIFIFNFIPICICILGCVVIFSFTFIHTDY